MLLKLIVFTSLALAIGTARDADPQRASMDQAQVARGRYLVSDVAVCWRCHTPRDAGGQPDRTQWLLGAPVPFVPATATPSWAQVAPRLSGLPPGTDEEFVKLMMTGVSRTGFPPRQPMPQFHMTRADAEAVLAYLKSLGSSE
ncbi:MAG TPA: c-type cytochrome [Vicinamibacterales bacterium]|jgi:mono/diheme cytochrome c family protein